MPQQKDNQLTTDELLNSISSSDQPFTYRLLSQVISKLSEEQLDQKVIVSIGDNENCQEVVEMSISREDLYWERHGDFIGNEEEKANYLKQDDSEDENELVRVPKGTVYLHAL